MDEMNYLRGLVKKHGRYLRQYFGFTLTEMAAKIGLGRTMLLMIIHGQKKMPAKYEQRFIEVFKELKIEEKSKDFKESEDQLWMRAQYKKIKLDNLAVFVTILSMVTFFEYIVGEALNNIASALKKNLRPVVECFKHSAIGLFLFIKTAINATTCSLFLSLNFNYI